jgi:hypothetical protein
VKIAKSLRLLAVALALISLADSTRAAEGQVKTVNLSRDLVPLGIASRNLPADDPAFDARPLFEAAVAYAADHHIERLTVDRGTYYFLTPEDAQTYLRFPALSDLTIDLAGSRILFTGAFLQGFALVNCDHVTLTNFTIDFVTPPYTEVELASVDPNARTLSYRTLPNWPDPATFNDAPTLSHGPGEPAPSIVLWGVAFRDGDILPGTSRMQVAQPITAGRLDLVQDNTPWTQSATLSTLEPGDTIVVTQRGGQPPLLAIGGQFITISHGTVFGASAIAVLLNRVSHSTVDDLKVVPRAGALFSSNADGIHFVDAGADDHIRHSMVARTLDDALAIDSLDPALVQKETGPQQVVVTRTAFIRFPDGTDVDFVDPVSGAEIAGATILTQNPPDSDSPIFDQMVTLTFDRDLPTLGVGFGMAFADPAARGTGSTIEDNTVEDILFGRGIWIGGAQSVTVARNRIGRSSNGGVAVAQNTSPVYPLPPARDIVIEGNILRGSLGPMASGSGTEIATGAILVETTGSAGGFSAAAPNANISILRNAVANSGRSGLWIGELDGGKIEDNVITDWDEHPELPLFGVNAQLRAELLQDFTMPLVVHGSPDIDLRGNKADGDGEP